VRTIPTPLRLSRALVLAVLAAACGSEHRSVAGPSEPELAARPASNSLPGSGGASILSSNDRGEVEFKGKVESVGSNEFKVFGVTVLVDAKTEFDGDHLRALSDLQVGEIVKIEGRLLSSGSVLAKSVERDDDHVEFHGPVKVVDSTHVRIGQVVVVIDTRTRVLVDCNGATVADIKNDVMVHVSGTLQDDGTVLAVQVNVAVQVSVEVTCRVPRPRPSPGGDGDDDDDD